MQISDLKPRMGNVDVTADVIEVEAPREFAKFGRQGRVANAVLEDSTGKVKLTLWNEQVEQVKKGDKVHISNGYVNEWQGEMQLTTGKFGKMEIVTGTEPAAPKAETVEDASDDEFVE